MARSFVAWRAPEPRIRTRWGIARKSPRFAPRDRLQRSQPADSASSRVALSFAASLWWVLYAYQRTEASCQIRYDTAPIRSVRNARCCSASAAPITEVRKLRSAQLRRGVVLQGGENGRETDRSITFSSFFFRSGLVGSARPPAADAPQSAP